MNLGRTRILCGIKGNELIYLALKEEFDINDEDLFIELKKIIDAGFKTNYADPIHKEQPYLLIDLYINGLGNSNDSSTISSVFHVETKDEFEELLKYKFQSYKFYGYLKQPKKII